MAYQSSKDTQITQPNLRSKTDFDHRITFDGMPKDLPISRENSSTLISDNYRLQVGGSIPGVFGLAPSGRIEKDASRGTVPIDDARIPETNFNFEPSGESSLDDSMTSQALREFYNLGWYTEPTFIDLIKSDRGLGFGVVAYEVRSALCAQTLQYFLYSFLLELKFWSCLH